MSDIQKWFFLEHAPSRDAGDRRIRDIAHQFRQASGGNPRRFAQLALTVARDWVKQLTDTDRVGGEDIAGFTRDPMPDDAVQALVRGYDDCDAKARLFVALCLAGGIPARMVPYWERPGEPLKPRGEPTEKLAHVAAEVYLNGAWIPVETTLARARLGELGTYVPKESTGRWLLS
jgi:transglutaminase-like putative cysteine protease